VGRYDDRVTNSVEPPRKPGTWTRERLTSVDRVMFPSLVAALFVLTALLFAAVS
jgi:hypothetical protein